MQLRILGTPPVFGNIFAEAVPLFLYSTSWAIGQQSRPLSESLVCTALHSVSLFGMERSGAAYPAMAAKSVDWIIQFFSEREDMPMSHLARRLFTLVLSLCLLCSAAFSLAEEATADAPYKF